MKKKLPAIAILALSAALAVTGWLILPDTVIIQFTVTGNGIRTAPKLVGIALPLLLGLVGGVRVLAKDDKDSYKYLAVGGLGVLIGVLSLLFNT